MTELLHGDVEVRVDAAGEPRAVRMHGVWRDVDEVALTWRVETDWWRAPVRRDYMRCLLAGGECIDMYRDIDRGEWALVRRYD